MKDPLLFGLSFTKKMGKTVEQTQDEMANYRLKVSAIIVNAEGKILLGRFKSEGLNAKRKRILPGGGVEEESGDEQFLIKELYKELGIVESRLVPIEKIGDFKMDYSDEYLEQIREKNGQMYTGKIESIYLLKYTGTTEEINLRLGNDFFAYRWIDVKYLKSYLPTMLLRFISDSKLEEKIQSL